MKKLKYFLVFFFVTLFVTAFYLNSVSFLTSLLYSDSLNTKRWGVDGLISKGPKIASSVLTIAQNSNENTEIRREAVYVLGEVLNEKVVFALIQLLQGNAPELVRAQAAYSLRKAQSSAVLSALITAYRTGPKSVRAKVLMAMGEMDLPKIIPVLKEALADKDQFLRDVASAALEHKNITQ